MFGTSFDLDAIAYCFCLISVDVKQQGMNHNVAGGSFPVIQGLKDEVIVSIGVAFPAFQLGLIEL